MEFSFGFGVADLAAASIGETVSPALRFHCAGAEFSLVRQRIVKG
jgi:hypothetical protein